MPTYVYECRDCHHRLEVIQHFSEDPLAICPRCGGALQRLLFPPAIIFKGSGWYCTDHRPPSGDEPSRAEEPAVSKHAPDNGGQETEKEAVGKSAPGEDS